MSTTRSRLGTARLASAMNHIFAAYGFVLQLSPRLHDVTSLPFPYVSHGEDAAAPLLEVHPDPLPEPFTAPPYETEHPEQFLLLASIVFNFCPCCRLPAGPAEARQGKGRRTEGLGAVTPPASRPFPVPTDNNRRVGSCEEPRSATLLHAEPQRSYKRLSVKPCCPCLHLNRFMKMVQNLARMLFLLHKPGSVHYRSATGASAARSRQRAPAPRLLPPQPCW